LFALKGREKRKPLILFVPSIAHAERLSGKFPARVRRILRALWPGAFTAVLPLVRKMPPGVGLNGTVGIRIPDHPVPLGLLKRLRKPLATTSANLSGEAPECDAEKASAALGGRTAVVAGCSGNVPSTVADLTRWPPVILREGAVSGRRLRQLCRGG
jgi:L-threonylcarbamoyladenylate synthase